MCLSRGSLGGGRGIETRTEGKRDGVGVGDIDRQRILEIITVVRAGGPPLHSHDGRWRLCRRRPCSDRYRGGGEVLCGRRRGDMRREMRDQKKGKRAKVERRQEGSLTR